MSYPWTHVYKAPVPANSTITEHRPGEKLARAVSEIQEVVVVEMSSEDDRLTVTKEGNNVTLSLGDDLGGGAEPDNKSIELNEDGKLQAKGLGTAQVRQPFQKISESGECGFDWVRAHD